MNIPQHGLCLWYLVDVCQSPKMVNDPTIEHATLHRHPKYRILFHILVSIQLRVPYIVDIQCDLIHPMEKKEDKQKLDMLYKWIWFDFRNWFPYLCDTYDDIYVFINKRLFRLQRVIMFIVYIVSSVYTWNIILKLRFMQILLSSIHCCLLLYNIMSLCVSVRLLVSDSATLNSQNSKAIKICANVIIIKERRKEKN